MDRDGLSENGFFTKFDKFSSYKRSYKNPYHIEYKSNKAAKAG